MSYLGPFVLWQLTFHSPYMWVILEIEHTHHHDLSGSLTGDVFGRLREAGQASETSDLDPLGHAHLLLPSIINKEDL